MRWHVQCPPAAEAAAPVMLLLHGTGASSHSWHGLYEPLGRSFRVVAPDLPGHAASGLPAQGQFDLPGMARAVAALLQALHLQPDVIVGHSAGAAVAVRLCLDGHAHPHAVVGLNAALCPLDGWPGRLFSPAARWMSTQPWVSRLFTWRAGDPAVVERLLAGTGSMLDATGRAAYAQLLRSPSHVEAALAMMARWQLDALWHDLPMLRPDLTLVVGQGDRTVPAVQADAARARRPATRVVRLEGLGHLAHEEAPQRVAQWLSDLLQPALRGATRPPEQAGAA